MARFGDGGLANHSGDYQLSRLIAPANGIRPKGALENSQGRLPPLENDRSPRSPPQRGGTSNKCRPVGAETHYLPMFPGAATAPGYFRAPPWGEYHRPRGSQSPIPSFRHGRCFLIRLGQRRNTQNPDQQRQCHSLSHQRDEDDPEREEQDQVPIRERAFRCAGRK